jgi:hypothetical protein
MRCLTDDEIARGIEAVIAATVGAEVVPALAASNLAIFLQAAQPTDGDTDDEWPITHPMHCRECARAITDADGTALVTIWIVERQWRCAICTEARHG